MSTSAGFPGGTLKVSSPIGLIDLMDPNDDVIGSDHGPKSVDTSFELWYRREYRNISRSLVLITGNAEVAVEAASEACARALERWDRVSVMASPSGWTYTVGLNVARRMLRRARLEALLMRRVAVPPPIREDAPELWEAVRQLPRQQRVAVVLHYVADLSQKDVASAMGVAEGTVASTLHRARKRLAESLGQPVETKEAERE
jgi:RNA polymerase sigma-70 factor (ECF subfamily)